jgi:hypothetical protein
MWAAVAVLADSSMEFRRPSGMESVAPSRQLLSRSSFSTTSTSVRPPA